jgi:TonB family protein
MTTITTKDSAEAKSLGKQGTQSQVPAGKSAEGGRSNPVCLELGVTIRSLPTENGAATKPIRVEGRTVIVFDNGAVLRCAENLPVGQSFILSNPNGHDVVCIVVGGRNLPSVKGYVEVQFTEAVKDFWGIHDSAPTPPAVATVPEPRRDAAQQTAAIGTRVELPAKNPNMQAGNAPSFDDIGGLLSSPTAPIVPERKAPSAASSERAASTVSSYSQSGISTPGLVANITSSEAEQQEEKNAKQAVAEALSNALASGPMAVANAEANQVPTSNAFARKGLMAYDQGETKAAFLGGRMPMIGGAIALVLVGIGVGAFLMNRGSSPAPAAATATVTEPASTPASTASSNPGLPSDSAAGTSEDTARLSAQNAAVELNNGGASLSAIPAVVSNSGSHDSKLDKEDSRGPDSSEKLRAQSAVSATRHPSIASLKMSAPSAPRRKPSDLGAGAASLTDMVADQPVANAGLLTASGRTSMQPAPPPGTLLPVPAAVQPTAVKTVAPKLISSVHLNYPPSAKQTGIQGTVTVIASVDANGTVSSAKALNGPLLLRQSAVDSVKQWKYSPGLADGRPVASQVTVSLEFKLN